MKRTPLRPVPPADHTSEPGFREWKAQGFGRCQCCGEPGRLERHHVVHEQHVRSVNGNPWDLRNALELGVHCRCHRDHHQAARRLPCSVVPPEAIEFAIELLGAAVADRYFDRYYSAC